MTNRNLSWLRLEEVINRANMTVNSFGRHIGLSRSESLYQIKAGRFGISHNLAQRIVEKFPEISLGWLLSGEGKMLCDEHPSQNIPYYDHDVTSCIHLNSELLQPTSTLSLSMIESCDCAFRSFDDAIGDQIMTGSIVFLKKIAPQAIIPGRFYVIITANFVILRRLSVAESATNREYIIELTSDKQNNVRIKEHDILGLYRVVANLKMY